MRALSSPYGPRSVAQQDRLGKGHGSGRRPIDAIESRCEIGRSAMISRRTFLSVAAGTVAAPGLSYAQLASQKVALYANVGAELTHYDVDIAGAALTKKATVTLPAA